MRRWVDEGVENLFTVSGKSGIIFKDNRFYKFLHIPIQSASNNILRKMKRNYQIEKVKETIYKIKEFDPKFTFATDIIVGFPTETQLEHRSSLNFIENWKPSILNISKFTPRPKTEAKNMKQLKSQIIKRRSREFSLIFNNYSQNEKKKWIGWQGSVFINEYHMNYKYPYMGRNRYYIPVLCKKGKIGQTINIEIVDYLNHSFIGV